MGILGDAENLFSGGARKAAEDRENNLRLAQGQLKNYYQQGMDQLNPLEKLNLSQLPFLQNLKNQEFSQGSQEFQNPGQSYQNIMSGYEESPAATSQRNQMTHELQNQAQASGMSGSTDFMNSMANHLHNLSSQDRQRYFQNVMGIQGQGQQAMGEAGQIGSHLFDTGTRARLMNSQDLLSLGNQMSGLQGQIGGAKADRDKASALGIGRMIGSGVDAYYGGPEAFKNII